MQSIPHSALRTPHSAFHAAAIGLALIVLPGCAGYQIGNRSLYRPDIRTVHVPVVQSESFRRYLGERLTEAIVKEVELRTPYKVVGTTEWRDWRLYPNSNECEQARRLVRDLEDGQKRRLVDTGNCVERENPALKISPGPPGRPR